MRKINKEEVFDIVKDILVKEYYVKGLEITHNTTINNDCGIDGDDADEFLQKIQEEIFLRNYLVEFYSFNFDDFFSPEGLSLKSIFSSKKEYKYLTIESLINYIYNHSVYYDKNISGL